MPPQETAHALISLGGLRAPQTLNEQVCSQAHRTREEVIHQVRRQRDGWATGAQASDAWSPSATLDLQLPFSSLTRIGVQQDARSQAPFHVRPQGWDFLIPHFFHGREGRLARPFRRRHFSLSAWDASARASRHHTPVAQCSPICGHPSRLTDAPPNSGVVGGSLPTSGHPARRRCVCANAAKGPFPSASRASLSCETTIHLTFGQK